MKIKLAFLDHDENYLNKITSFLGTKYSDKLEIYAFTDPDSALSAVKTSGISVLLADESFEINSSMLPAKCCLAFLVESAGIDAVNGEKAICKFQKIDVVYKQILNIYSDNNGALSFNGDGVGKSKTIIFSSPCGGAGTSTMAAACALHFASMGKKVLHLCLEKLGSSDVFFSGDGQGNMSDLIYALKSRKANLALKIESCVRHDARGVYFYAPSRLALDMMELTTDEIMELFTELKSSTDYDYIIADIDFSLDRNTLQVLGSGSALIWVSDGSVVCNSKIARAFESLQTLERSGLVSILGQTCIAYNKFSNKTGKILTGLGLKEIGGMNRIEHAASAQIMEQISPMRMFDQIFSSQE